MVFLGTTVIHLLPPKGVFLSRISRKKGINFAHCGMKFGMVFKGTTKVFFFSAVNE